jgi:hypothetical protein
VAYQGIGEVSLSHTRVGGECLGVDWARDPKARQDAPEDVSSHDACALPCAGIEGWGRDHSAREVGLALGEQDGSNEASHAVGNEVERFGRRRLAGAGENEFHVVEEVGEAIDMASDSLGEAVSPQVEAKHRAIMCGQPRGEFLVAAAVLPEAVHEHDAPARRAALPASEEEIWVSSSGLVAFDPPNALTHEGKLGVPAG